jgi:hypothetical protein
VHTVTQSDGTVTVMFTEPTAAPGLPKGPFWLRLGRSE